MKHLLSARFVAAAALVLGAVGAATAAHARSDVFFSVGVQVPGAYVQPAPMYVQPAPVYVQPAPVYMQSQPVYVTPRPVYVQPSYSSAWDRGWERRGPYGDWDRDGVPNAYDRHNDRHHRHGHLRGPWGDYDRDGVPNRYDHFPANPYRR